MASAVDTANTAIHVRFDDQWGTTGWVSWPNVMPGVDKPPDKEPWVQLDVLWGDAFIDTMETTASNRMYGLIQITLYCPVGEGEAIAMGHVDTLRNIFNRWSGSGVVCGASSGPRRIPDEQWARYVIDTPFDLVDS